MICRIYCHLLFCSLLALTLFTSPAAHAQRVETTSQVVETYRVYGWQHDLVQNQPNLHQYYWEPMTRKRVLTTQTTQPGAKHAPFTFKRSNNVLAYHAPTVVPATHNEKLATSAPKTVSVPASYSQSSASRNRTSTDTALTYSCSKPKQYAATPSSGLTSTNSNSSVFGVLVH